MKVLIATCNNLVTLTVVLLCKQLLVGVCDEIARQSDYVCETGWSAILWYLQNLQCVTKHDQVIY